MEQPIEHAAGSAMPGDVEAVYVRIAKRLMPFLVLLFVMAWLDRVNVGFAKLQMVKDLGFSEAVYGFGAGIFYLGYVLFEIPSNLFLQKIGARRTIARITILWGIASIGTMFVKTATWFYILRFLLGAFEAGLYPGVILYLTYWFPAGRCQPCCSQAAPPQATSVIDKLVRTSRCFAFSTCARERYWCGVSPKIALNNRIK